MAKNSTILTGAALGVCAVVAAIACGAALGDKTAPQPDPSSTDTTVVFDFPDCDKDDRSPHWDTKDCGPSPKPAATKGNTRPSPKPRTTRR